MSNQELENHEPKSIINLTPEEVRAFGKAIALSVYQKMISKKLVCIDFIEMLREHLSEEEISVLLEMQVTTTDQHPENETLIERIHDIVCRIESKDPKFRCFIKGNDLQVIKWDIPMLIIELYIQRMQSGDSKKENRELRELFYEIESEVDSVIDPENICKD